MNPELKAKLKAALWKALHAALLAAAGYLVRELGGPGTVPPLDTAARGVKAAFMRPADYVPPPLDTPAE